MVGQLDGQIARLVNQGLKQGGITQQGTITRQLFTGSFDSNGDPELGSTISYTFNGFVEEYSEYTRAAAQIPQEDAKLNILAASLGTGVKPFKSDDVIIRGERYIIKQVDTDPAKALYVCRATRINTEIEDSLRQFLLVYGTEAALEALLDQLEIFANTEVADHLG